MKILRNIFLILISICIILFIIYELGPKPQAQNYSDSFPSIPIQPTQVAKMVQADEAKLHVKPDNSAEVLFADSLKKEKTHFSLVYLHGFSASHEEGNPLHLEFAHRYHCNLFLSRLEGHGLADTPSFSSLKASDLYASAVKALAIGTSLGDSVILMATSGGGALALMLAAREKNAPIKALILYSPCIKIFDPNAALLDKPWGLQIAHIITGKKNVISEHNDSLSRRYWYHDYRLEGAVALQQLLDDGMQPSTFEKVHVPVLTCMYYKDKVHQDSTVSTDAIRWMVKNLGTPSTFKPLVLIPGAGDHVIASYIRSHDLDAVRIATFGFADQKLHLPH